METVNSVFRHGSGGVASYVRLASRRQPVGSVWSAARVPLGPSGNTRRVSGPATGPGFPVLQPGRGRTRGTYVRARPEEISWGYLPNRDSMPVATVDSGEVVTLDTVSHEGVLEDQGQGPREFFKTFGVAESRVLDDAIAIAAGWVD